MMSSISYSNPGSVSYVLVCCFAPTLSHLPLRVASLVSFWNTKWQGGVRCFDSPRGSHRLSSQRGPFSTSIR